MKIYFNAVLSISLKSPTLQIISFHRLIHVADFGRNSQWVEYFQTSVNLDILSNSSNLYPILIITGNEWHKNKNSKIGCIFRIVVQKLLDKLGIAFLILNSINLSLYSLTDSLPLKTPQSFGSRLLIISFHP